MAKEKSPPTVDLSVAEVAIIIVEALTGQLRPEGSDAVELLKSMCRNPMLQPAASMSMEAALRIADYVKSRNDTTRALHNIGAI